MKDLNDRMERIKEMVGPLKPGEVIHVSVKHDDGCPSLLTGRLIDCTCNPDIESMKLN